MEKMTVFEFLTMLAHRLWSTNTILLLERPSGKPLGERKPCPGEFRPISEDNIADCAVIEDATHYVPIYRQMLAQGDYGQYGYLHGKCVYRQWLKCSGDILYVGCLVRTLAANEVYDHYVFCTPAARGQGVHAEGITQLIMRFMDHTFYALIAPNNISSLKNALRNGYEIRGRITVKCRFLRRTLTETPLIPAEGEALLMCGGGVK